MTTQQPTYKTAYKAGRAFNGSHKDRGTLIHIVPQLANDTTGDWFRKSLCGTEPGHRSFGWSETDRIASCPKCLKMRVNISKDRQPITLDRLDTE